MMQNHDYFPSRYGDLASFLSNLLKRVSAAQSRLRIDDMNLMAFQSAVNAYLAANRSADHPSATNVDLQERKDCAEKAKIATRHFVHSNLRYNEALTDRDRIDMGLIRYNYELRITNYEL